MPIYNENRKLLFEDDIEDERTIENLISINHDFARKFEERKRTEELALLSSKYEHGTGGSTDSEEDDEDESDSSSSSSSDIETDIEFIRTIAKVRSRDSSIYDSNTKFYTEHQHKEEGGGKERKGDPLTLKKYAHKMLLENAENAGDNIEDDKPHQEEWPVKISYTEEQKELRSALIKAANCEENESEDEVEFLNIKARDNIDHDANGYALSLIGAIADDKNAHESMRAWFDTFEAKEKKQVLPNPPSATKPQKSSQSDSSNADDAFLASYILNQRWKYKSPLISSQKSSSLNEQTRVVEESDPDDVEDADQFEVAFNRRFEEPLAGSSFEGTQLISHSRDQPSSIRNSDERRKNARKAKMESRRAKEQREAEELKRLKMLKKQEMASLAEKVGLIAGIKRKASKISDLLKQALDDNLPFDEAEHDARMASLFDDSYYEAKDPIRHTLGDEHSIDSTGEDRNNETHKEGTPLQTIKEKLKKLEDEYFHIHYEDKTRFKYTAVPPSTFGLKIGDILTAEDKELNRYISLRKFRPYRDQEEQLKEIAKYSRSKISKKFYYGRLRSNKS